MREEVEEAKEDGGRLLNPHEAVEGPFAVELDDRLEVRRFALDSLVGDYVLAGIVAFGRAVPEQDAVLQSCACALANTRWDLSVGSASIYVRMCKPRGPQFSSSQS